MCVAPKTFTPSLGAFCDNLRVKFVYAVIGQKAAIYRGWVLQSKCDGAVTSCDDGRMGA